MNRRILHIFFLILLLTILSFSPPGRESLFTNLRKFIWDTSRGVLTLIDNASNSLREIGQVFFKLKALLRERLTLLEHSEELKTLKLKIRILEEENKNLQELLKFRLSNSSIKTLGVRVIGQDTLSISKLLIIDRGKKDGVIEGSLLIYGGAVAGLVKEVYEDTSIVVLINSKEFSLGGIVNTTGELGIVKGETDHLYFEFLSPNPKANEGDIVITTNEDGFGGIIIGELKKIYRASKITPIGELKPVINPNKTRLFLVTVSQ